MILVLNQRAPHVCHMPVKTRDKLDDESLLERSLLIVDAVYWQGEMYDCSVNTELIKELWKLLK